MFAEWVVMPILMVLFIYFLLLLLRQGWRIFTLLEPTELPFTGAEIVTRKVFPRNRQDELDMLQHARRRGYVFEMKDANGYLVFRRDPHLRLKYNLWFVR